ncbi:MAG: phage major capsid protein, partial [Pikeienuella sp.]
MTTTPIATNEHEVKSAVSGFLNEFKEFQSEIKSRMKHQDDRISQVSRPVSAHRPALGTPAQADAPHKKAISAYLRGGDETELKSLSLEGKALSSDVLADGGFLIDPQTAEAIRGVLRSSSSLRSVANVATVDAGVYDVLVDHTDIGAGWTTEVDGVSETDTPQIDRISIALHELSAAPKASQR